MNKLNNIEKCPICQQEFETPALLITHVKNTMDDEHKLLAHAYSLVRYGRKIIHEVPEKFCKAFNCLRVTNDLQRAMRLADITLDKLKEEKQAAEDAKAVKCPLCDQSFKSSRKFNAHIRETQDNAHKLLLALKDITGANYSDLPALQGLFVEAFNTLANGSYEAALDTVQSIHNQITTDLANEAAGKRRANELAKNAILISKRYQQIAKEAEEYEQIVTNTALIKREEKRRFAAMSPQDRPMALVDYFYHMTGGNAFIARDVPLVKALYTKYRLTSDQIRDIMNYAHNIGDRTLSRIHKLIDDGLTYNEKIKQIDQEKTPAFLVKLFYELRGLYIIPKFFIKEENMIATAIRDNRVNYEQAEAVVRSLAAQSDCPLLYFDSRVAAMNKNNKLFQKSTIVVYTEEKDIEENVRNVLAGRLKLMDVAQNIRHQVTVKIDEVYKNGTFDQKYDHYEWAFKIGLPLTTERQLIAKKSDRCSWFANAFANCKDQAKLAKITAMYDRYVTWARDQGVEIDKT